MQGKGFCSYFLVPFILIAGLNIAGCGGSSNDLPAGNNTSDTINENGGNGNLSQDSTVVTSIVLSAYPATVAQGSTSSVEATVLDQDSAAVGSGIEVTFTVSDDTLGTIGSSASTNNGIAMAVFTASSVNTGTVTIRAAVGNVSEPIDLEIIE